MEGDFQTRAPFWRDNQELIEAVHEMEAKSRRRDILVDEERIYAFYDQRIPEGISTTPAFEKWLKQGRENSSRQKLYMREAELLREESEWVADGQFPDHLDINGMALPLEYSFEPGSKEDGVTLAGAKGCVESGLRGALPVAGAGVVTGAGGGAAAWPAEGAAQVVCAGARDRRPLR